MKLVINGIAVIAVALSGSAMAAENTFGAADRDGDGLLSMAEVVLAMPDATPDAFNSADRDQNGVLNEAEFIAAVNDGLLPEG